MADLAMLENTELRTCACGATFRAMIVLRSVVKCATCVDREEAEALEKWRADEFAKLPATVDAKLASCGLGPQELAARLDRVPKELKRKIDRDRVRELMGGGAAAGLRGFGLSGGAGIGKTHCLAALLRSRIVAQLEAKLPDARPDQFVGYPWHIEVGFRWLNWPQKAAELKTMSLQPGGMIDIQKFTAHAQRAPLLVLDDLGRERIGRSYDEDLAVGVLDQIIDGRSRKNAALLWTSNLNRAGIATRYGAAITSRLLGLAPAIELQRMADLRLA